MTLDRLSDEDYKAIIGHFQQNNPKLAGDPDGIRAEIAKMDAEITKLAEEKPEGFEPAVHIFWQARNAFARFVGVEEIPLPIEPAGEPEPEPEEIESKHVGLLISSGGPLLAAFDKSLGLFKEQIRFHCFGGMNDLLEALLAGKLCGIIGIHSGKDGSVEQHVRHDLKNLPDWEYDRAQKFALPPCADVFMPYELVEIVSMIRQMQIGQFLVVKDGEKFDLEQAMPVLVSQMLIPAKTVRVITIDDTPKEVEGIRRILGAWHGVDSVYLNPDEGLDVGRVAHECEVVLLDEAMGKLTGTAVQAELVSHGFGGIIASITGGEKPGWARDHFGGKAAVRSGRPAAEGFVRFMNRLIREVRK